VAVATPEKTELTSSNAAWHTLEAETALKKMAVRPQQGLSTARAEELARQYGANELIDKGTKHPFKILWEQLTAVMVLILLAAAGLSLVLGKYLEAGAIFAIVILFAFLGFIQEYRAEKAIAALKKMAVPLVRVYRNGAVSEITARELVPGDVVLLEAGNVVPADVRIIESANLRIQEAALTGESEPIEKETHAFSKPDMPLGDRKNMGYMGTQITYGRGLGLVVETGMRTELGKIANLIQGVKNELTPLQQRLDAVGKLLAIAGVVVALLVMGIGIIAGESLTDMLLTAISVAVAVIPEGLPAVVTFTLALGAQRMLKRNALIRKLPAVETLGSVTVICSDKTGTLTENRMTVTALEVAGHSLDLSHSAKPELSATAPMLLVGGALCNDAVLQKDEDGKFKTIGDPTEGALLAAALKFDLDYQAWQKIMPRVGELPFDSDRKRMTTIHQRPSGDVPAEISAIWGKEGLSPEMPYIAITKGAVDGLLDLSNYVLDNGQIRPMNENSRTRIDAANDRFARNGIRVLGVAFRPIDRTNIKEQDESNLIFIGLTGMIDPPRAEVKLAVAKCETAGIRPIMITGDHPLTASYIARDLGIAKNELVLTGVELNKMSDAELQEKVEKVSVFARVSPEHKLRIVQALQTKGHVAAMTGDGVNDAPALKKADIGVAMGITGTDVSKEASDMVLRDDNFATIVAAVEEGRVIYDNLRRFVKFAVAGNVGKVAIMLLWPLPFLLLGLPLEAAVALLPLQLLWLNLMTDGLLGLSMGVEPAEKNVMSRPPHSPKAGIFSGGMGIHVIWVGLLIGLLGLGVGFVYIINDQPQWQTMIFTATAFMQVFHALVTRSSYESLFRIGVFSNRVMWYIIGVVVVLQLIALYTPLANFLGLQALGLVDLLVCIALGSVIFIAVEIEKYIVRRQMKKN
jgi:Ca2+-transporting ATPase